MNEFIVRKAINGFEIVAYGDDGGLYVFDKPTKVVKAVKELLEAMVPSKTNGVPF
jgi:hypothetical protein